MCKDKDNVSQESVVRELVNAKDISHIPAVKYGIDNESLAASTYAKYMQPLQILDCGVVISPQMPWLCSSPDRKVIDKDVGFGLVEIKCPYTLRNLRPEDACKDPSFYCEIVEGKPTLKRKHDYYYQIQVQLGICGLAWCDFVVFFQKGIIIERIRFDNEFWNKMIAKLTVFLSCTYATLFIEMLIVQSIKYVNSIYIQYALVIRNPPNPTKNCTRLVYKYNMQYFTAIKEMSRKIIGPSCKMGFLMNSLVQTIQFN